VECYQVPSALLEVSRRNIQGCSFSGKPHNVELDSWGKPESIGLNGGG